jgi:hypothetical protein
MISWWWFCTKFDWNWLTISGEDFKKNFSIFSLFCYLCQVYRQTDIIQKVSSVQADRHCNVSSLQAVRQTDTCVHKMCQVYRYADKVCHVIIKGRFRLGNIKCTIKLTGATALTLTPDVAHSKDKDLVKLSTADRAAPVWLHTYKYTYITLHSSASTVQFKYCKFTWNFFSWIKEFSVRLYIAFTIWYR